MKRTTRRTRPQPALTYAVFNLVQGGWEHASDEPRTYQQHRDTASARPAVASVEFPDGSEFFPK